MNARMIAIFVAFIGLVAASGCATEPPRSTIVVPSTATTAPEYRGDGSIPTRRYVVRMSDGQRDWEVEFPETATGYEIRIPLEEGGSAPGMRWDGPGMTDADRELMKDMRRSNPALEREGVFVDGRNVQDPDSATPGAELTEEGEVAREREAGARVGEDQPAQSRPSYLLGIDEVQKLYGLGNYELAMVRLTNLEKAYPNDERLLSMKGTLWLKLGREDLARETWERVLQVNPDNRAVLEALKQLE